MAHLVTLLSDFGIEDSYSGEVKAILLSGKDIKIVDITHQVPPFDTTWGAFQLLRSYRYFPENTYHLTVIDPGVGSSRTSLYIRTQNYHFVGPDNGVLLWAVQDCERREKKKARIFEIPAKEKLLPTFHGRDLFAPFIVEHIKNPKLKLKSLSHMEGREFPMFRQLPECQVGEIIGKDRFGNIITSIPFGNATKAEAQVGGWRQKLTTAENYAEIAEGTAAIIRGSHGFWEIACKKNSAWELLNVETADQVIIFPK